MQYEIRYSNQFKRQYKKLLRSGDEKTLRKLKEVIIELSAGKKLLPVYREHGLTGQLQGFSECHICPDWLLIFKICRESLVLELIATGSHSELFG